MRVTGTAQRRQMPITVDLVPSPAAAAAADSV